MGWGSAVRAVGLFGRNCPGRLTGSAVVLLIIAGLPCAGAQAQGRQLGRDSEALPHLRPRIHPTKPARSRVPTGYDAQRVQVKFRDELELSLDGTGTPVEVEGRGLRSPRSLDVFGQLHKTGARWRQATTLSPARLQEIRSRAQVKLQREIPNFASYFVLTLPPGAESQVWMDSLNALHEVELATPLPLPAPAPSTRMSTFMAMRNAGKTARKNRLVGGANPGVIASAE